MLRATLSQSRIGDILVHKGVISKQQLNDALKQQRETAQPLGHILLQTCAISKIDLAKILFRQKVLRLTATSLLCVASLTAVSKRSYSAKIKDVPAQIMLDNTASQQIQNLVSYPKIFGATEKRSNNLKAFTKWTGMFERFDKAMNAPSAQRLIASMKAELADYRSSSVYAMADSVNDMMNKKKYIVDNKNWGKSDYWATPVEFMARGGDCEDFAIAKYVALRALGVPENRMRIAIVQDLRKNIPHAILIVYSEKGPMVLDNQIKTIRHVNNISHYKPIFSINQDAWWLHTMPDANKTVVASARH